MNVKDRASMVGHVVIERNGVVERDIDNLVVTVGKEWVASRMKDENIVMSHMALGTNGGDTDVSQTQLLAEIANSRVDITGGGVVAGNTVQYVTTWIAGVATDALAEAGIFNHADAGLGDMLARVRFEVINKGVDDLITITWTITVV